MDQKILTMIPKGTFKKQTLKFDFEKCKLFIQLKDIGNFISLNPFYQPNKQNNIM